MCIREYGIINKLPWLGNAKGAFFVNRLAGKAAYDDTYYNDTYIIRCTLLLYNDLDGLAI